MVWKSTAISTKTKLRIFSSNVKSVLLYGAETWRVTKINTNKIQTFVNGCLRRILRLRWYDRVTNTDLWTRTGQEPMTTQVKRRRWRWIGHTLRKTQSSVTRQVLEWNPQGTGTNIRRVSVREDAPNRLGDEACLKN